MEETTIRKPLDYKSIRETLASSRGKKYWQSLEELSDTPEFQQWVDDEFPDRDTLKTLDRRDFLKFMGGSLLMASLAGCRSVFMPTEKVVPYVNAPEGMAAGESLYFATAASRGGYATGIVVRSTMGRPIKIDGNPDHPSSLGGVDAITQATLLDLYDPDRSQFIVHNGGVDTWEAFLKNAQDVIATQATTQGAGIRILTETTTSPTLTAQIAQIQKKYPKTKWIQYEPANRDHAAKGSKLAFGEPVNTVYHLKKADVILSIDGDFLYSMPGSLRMARDYADRRNIQGNKVELNRLYVVEGTHSITGSNADHRLPLLPSKMEIFTYHLAAALGVPGVQKPATLPKGVSLKWIHAVARDLKAHAGRSVVLVGDAPAPEVHALGHAINAVLGNVGKTVVYTDPVESHFGSQNQDFKSLTEDMQKGQVKMLLILGGNPVFTAPADVPFKEALAKVKFSLHFGMYQNETTEKSHWHIPESHYLESWSDTRAWDGTVTIMQPLIAPLYPTTKSVHEVISYLFAEPLSDFKIIQNHWKTKIPVTTFERFWASSLDKGVIQGSSLPPKQVTLKLQIPPLPKNVTRSGLEVIFLPDPTIYDGRFANNAWLQELPKPLVKFTWDNCAVIGASLAERMGLSNMDQVELNLKGRKLIMPIWVLPGCADDTVVLSYGYGRTKVGMVGKDTGFNTYQLRTSDSPWLATGLILKKIGGQYPVAATHDHQFMEGRDIVRMGSIQDYRKNPTLAPKHAEHEKITSLYPEPVFPDYKGYQWGMTIDLNHCIGCSACVTACQSENNGAVVGKVQVMRKREMHWIRVDAYFGSHKKSTNLDNPEVFYQPVLCMHCENAPCEVVCPVAATNHSHEGLNQMIYNRCVGTRYCSNNCPYKVRRFNFLNFMDKTDYPVRLLANNPRVTVRGRGVMEKCTYCVQRINAARIEAQKEGRVIRDGEIVTACESVCPTKAITFGDVADPNSRVSKLKKEPRNYALLAELGTRPRTTYLPRVKNLNPELGAL